MDDISLVRQKTAVELASFDDPDLELAPLLDTLRNHLESMRGNHEQVQGVYAATRQAGAALDDVLFSQQQIYDSMIQ